MRYLSWNSSPRIPAPNQSQTQTQTHNGNTSGPPLARDENLRAIRQLGRKAWKWESGSPMRSLAKTGVYRMKVIFGAHRASRMTECQVTEGAIRGRALNIMTHLGMPQSERVA